MSRIIRLIGDETLEISEYINSGTYFNHNAPTIEDIRKQISNIDDYCVFKEIINPFKLYGEKEQLQQRINKAIEELEDEIEQSDGCIYVELSEELYIKKLQEYLDILRGEDNESK